MPINLKNLNDINFELKKFQKSELLIVTKKRKLDDISSLINQGYKRFGENRVQEASEKYSQLTFENRNKISLDLIGPLQTNKTADALDVFDTIQTIDRPKLVQAVIKEIRKKNRPIKTKSFFIQINIGEETQKAGVKPSSFSSFYNYCLNEGLPIKGIMCIPPHQIDPINYFKQMVLIKEKIDNNLILSMGMSDDYLLALRLGSNLIRVGSKIFD